MARSRWNYNYCATIMGFKQKRQFQLHRSFNFKILFFFFFFSLHSLNSCNLCNLLEVKEEEEEAYNYIMVGMREIRFRLSVGMEFLVSSETCRVWYVRKYTYIHSRGKMFLCGLVCDIYFSRSFIYRYIYIFI